MRFYASETSAPLGSRKFVVVAGEVMPADTSDQRWAIIRRLTDLGLWSTPILDQDSDYPELRLFAFVA